jgi:hypothetical protein
MIPQKRVLDNQWIENHKNQLSKFMIVNPWSDPKIKKIGLYEMYIIDSISESLEDIIPIEEDEETKLGCINPDYQTLHLLLSNFLDTPNLDNFKKTYEFITNKTQREIKLYKWVDTKGDIFIPDIRLLESIDECLSWIYHLFN